MSLKKKELEDLFQYQTRNLKDSVKSQILKPSGRGGVYASRDYVSACALLAEYLKSHSESDFSEIFSSEDLWAGLDSATRFRLRAFTPCLASRYDELKDNEKKSVFEDKNWVASEKVNGCRGWLICVPGQEPKLFSRNYSDKDCGLLEYWDHISQVCAPHSDIFAIDVEIVFEPGTDISEDLEALGLETDSPLEAMTALLHTYPEEARKIQDKFHSIYNKDLVVMKLIAPLYFNGRNYLKRTLGEGIDVYHDCVARAKELGLNVKPIEMCNGPREEKEIFLNSILDNGGEGVVFWNRKGVYCTSENRSKTSFIKLKRSVKSTMGNEGMGDTIDGWISGFKMGSNGTSNEGLISAFEISCYITNPDGSQREHVIAVAPNIEKTTKELATIPDASGLYPKEVTMSDGSVRWFSLNPEFGHLVVECDGQALSAVSQRLEHPRILRYRPEKSPLECIYTQEFIDSQTTNHKDGIRYSNVN